MQQDKTEKTECLGEVDNPTREEDSSSISPVIDFFVPALLIFSVLLVFSAVLYGKKRAEKWDFKASSYTYSVKERSPVELRAYSVLESSRVIEFPNDSHRIILTCRSIDGQDPQYDAVLQRFNYMGVHDLSEETRYHKIANSEDSYLFGALTEVCREDLNMKSSSGGS